MTVPAVPAFQRTSGSFVRPELTASDSKFGFEISPASARELTSPALTGARRVQRDGLERVFLHAFISHYGLDKGALE